MPENWPATLPQAWLNTNYQETLPEVMVRTEMDAGPAKVRRRFSAQVTPIKAQMLLNAAQKDDLATFFNTTLAGGSLSFTFPHDGTAVLRFTGAPGFSKSAQWWLGAFELEKLP